MSKRITFSLIILALIAALGYMLAANGESVSNSAAKEASGAGGRVTSIQNWFVFTIIHAALIKRSWNLMRGSL